MVTVDFSVKTRKFLFLFHYFGKSPSTGKPSHRCSCPRSMPKREVLLGRSCPTTAEMRAPLTGIRWSLSMAAASPLHLQQLGLTLFNPPGLKHDFSEQCGLSRFSLSFPQPLTLLWREPALNLFVHAFLYLRMACLLYNVNLVSLRTRLSRVWHEVEWLFQSVQG